MSSFFKSRIVKPGAKAYLPLAVALKGNDDIPDWSFEL